MSRLSMAATLPQYCADAECGRLKQMLTVEQVERYRHDGYLFPLPALSTDEVAAGRAGLARFEHWLGTPLIDADRKWRSAGYIIMPWVDGLVRNEKILDAVESLIGPDILVYTSTFFIKE